MSQWRWSRHPRRRPRRQAGGPRRQLVRFVAIDTLEVTHEFGERVRTRSGTEDVVVVSTFGHRESLVDHILEVAEPAVTAMTSAPSICMRATLRKPGAPCPHAPCRIVQSKPRRAAAVAVATPCGPHRSRDDPGLSELLRQQGLAESAVNLIATPWLRSSRLRNTRTPPSAAKRGASVNEEGRA